MIEPLESRIAPAVLVSASQLANSAAAGGASVVAVDSHGNTIVAGTFFGTLALDAKGPNQHTLTTTDPAGDIYIAEYKPDGTFLWATQWGGSGGETAYGIAVDGQDNVFVTGGFASKNAGFPVLGPQGVRMSPVGVQDVFLLKLKAADGTPDLGFNGTGQIRFGGTEAAGGIEAGYSVAVDSAGQVYVGGTFASADAALPNSGFLIGTSGGQDAFILKVDGATGSQGYGFGNNGAESFGSQGYDAIFRVRVDHSDNVAAAYTSGDGSAGDQQSDNILYVHGYDGQRNYPFGMNTGEVNFIPSGMATTAPFDIAFDIFDNIYAAGAQGGKLQVGHYFAVSGDPDTNFSATGVRPLNVAPTGPVTLNVDVNDQTYITGLQKTGAFISTIGGYGTGGDTVTLSGITSFASAVDPTGVLVLRGTYTGNPNFGLSNDTVHLPARSAATLGEGMSDGFLLHWDHNGVDALNPLKYTDYNGNKLSVHFSGPGYAHIVPDGAYRFSSIDSIELFNTKSTTNLTVKIDVPAPFRGDLSPLELRDTADIGQVITEGSNQSVGNIVIGQGIALGGLDEGSTTVVHVSGKLNNLVTDDIRSASTITLGDGLPYADTLTNHPNLTLGDILGPNVSINVLGDGVNGDPGGGGLGNIVIGSWPAYASPGYINTTQSIGNLTVLHGDFYGILVVGKYPGNAPVHAFHPITTRTTPGSPHTNAANAGNINIEDGSWGSTGTEIAGSIGSFNATAFLAGASITAASIGSVRMSGGQFSGTLTLTDANANSVGAFTVGTDFTGVVNSSQPLKKVKIKGNFTGSLTAPAIAGISAYAFLGVAPEKPDDPFANYINVDGYLGKINATAGIIHDFQFETGNAFSGITVSAKGLIQDTVGINNVHIKAASIGNIKVTLQAAKSTSNQTLINLTGIENSTFTTTATGTTTTTEGNIGNLSVSLLGNSHVASARGIVDSMFNAQVAGPGDPSTANHLGKISVKVSGTPGDSIGMSNAVFTGDFIGNTTVAISPGAGAASAVAINGASYTATKAVGGISVTGDATAADVTALNVFSDGAIGTVKIATKTAANGSLVDSFILAGLEIVSPNGASDKDLLALIRAASLGGVTVSGDLSGTTIAAGGNIGAISVGGSAGTSKILAGDGLGADHALTGLDNTYNGSASVASVTVKGMFSSTSITAGVIPGAGGLGSGDTAASVFGTLTTVSEIGPLSFGSGAVLTGIPGAHTYVIEAAAIKKLTVPQAQPVTDFGTSFVLDLNGNGEDAADAVVQLIGAPVNA